MTDEIFYAGDTSLPTEIPGIAQEIYVSLREGMRRSKLVEILYRNSSGDESTREVLPEVLFHTRSGWFAAGFCRLRNESRVFRLDRIVRARLTDTVEESHGIAEEYRRKRDVWEEPYVSPEPPHPPRSPEPAAPEPSHEEVMALVELNCALCRHAGEGNIRAMTEDLAAGADVNDAGWTTPLLEAIFADKLESCRFLLEHGADPELAGWSHSRPPLVEAAACGRTEILRYFIEERGMDVNFRDRAGWPLLQRAVCWNQREVVECLLAHGADINIRSREKTNPLSALMSLNDSEEEEILPVAELLIRRGADVNNRDREGMTPLHYAAERNRRQCCKLLIDSGAAPDARDRRGNTPMLSLIIEHQRHWKSWDDNRYFNAQIPEVLKTLELLLACGADPNVGNNAGETPLMIAWGRSFRFLLDHGGDPNARDERGSTVAMHHAGSLDDIKALSGRGADILAKNKYFEDVLLLTKPDLEHVRTLIETYGFSVDDKDGRNSTVLHLVCDEDSDPEAVEYLLGKGANPNVRDASGETPRDHVDKRIYFENGSEEDYDVVDCFDDYFDDRTDELFAACEAMDPAGIRRAVTYGAHPNAHRAEYGGRTPLLTALLNYADPARNISGDRFAEILHILLEGGASPAAADGEGHTLATVLCELGNKPLLKECFDTFGRERLLRDTLKSIKELLKWGDGDPQALAAAAARIEKLSAEAD